MAGKIRGPNVKRALNALCSVLAHPGVFGYANMSLGVLRRLYNTTRKLPEPNTPEWDAWWRTAATSVAEAMRTVRNAVPCDPVSETAAAADIVKGRCTTERINELKAREEHRKAMAAKPSMLDGPGRCRVCGCTDDHACDGGCSWADAAHTICSRCAAPAPLAS